MYPPYPSGQLETLYGEPVGISPQVVVVVVLVVIPGTVVLVVVLVVVVVTPGIVVVVVVLVVTGGVVVVVVVLVVVVVVVVLVVVVEIMDSPIPHVEDVYFYSRENNILIANEYGILHGAVLSLMSKFGSKYETIKNVVKGGSSPISKYIAGLSEVS